MGRAPKLDTHFEVMVARGGTVAPYSAEKYATLKDARTECRRLLGQGESFTCINEIHTVRFVVFAEQVK